MLGWTLCAGVVRPTRRGRIRVTGPDPTDPVQIEAKMLSHPDDLKAAIGGMELCREIGNSAPLRPCATSVVGSDELWPSGHPVRRREVGGQRDGTPVTHPTATQNQPDRSSQTGCDKPITLGV